MSYNSHGEPCRNFCILSSLKITDPVDEKEKIVLSSFVSGGTGILIFIDPRTGKGESIALPADEGAWASYNLHNRFLIIGTCGIKGYIHCMDLKSREWVKSLRDEHETYIWNLVIGSDGMVYGGTYPGCALLRYNPEKHTLDNMGRMSPYLSNLYSRQVFGDVPGRIFINCGYDKPHASVYDLSTHKVNVFGKEGAFVKEANKDFICTITGDDLDFYNPLTLEQICGTISINLPKAPNSDIKAPISEFINNFFRPVKDNRIPEKYGNALLLEHGNKAGVRGQEYFYLKKDDSRIKLLPIPVEAPPTQILTITSGEDGIIWGTSNFGQTIFSYNPTDGTYWNSLTVCDNGGEVYGIKVIGGKVFMAAYAGGDHIVYDPFEKWDQANNINPKALASAGPDLIRPHGKSVIGPDNGFWTGWTAKYGTCGGGLTRIDPTSYDMKLWYDPIPEQSIESLAASEKYLYFTTSGRGNGLNWKTSIFCIAVCDTEGKLVHKVEFPEGTVPGCVEIAGKHGAVCLYSYCKTLPVNELIIFDSTTMEFTCRIKLTSICTCLLKKRDEQLLVFCENELFEVNTSSGELKLVAELPGQVKTATITAKGEIFFAVNEKLYSLK